jgi:STE24 endopeptidase
MLGSVLLAGLVAEGAARLLTPRAAMIDPEKVEAGAYFSPAEIKRGVQYARPQFVIGLARGALQAAALGRLVRRPPPLLSTLAGSATARGGTGAVIARGAGVGAVLSLGLGLPGLPLAALGRHRAIAVGLVTQSWRGWAQDLAKASAIETGLAAAGGGAVVALTRRYPRGWWLPGAGASIALGTLLAALAPVVLDPIFNDFTPLEEGQTRSDVLALAEAAGVRVGEVYSIDASRRTTAANAYVTGLGPTKRVVLFDTLLDRYSRDEVRIVVAHELAHVRHRDVPRSVAFAAIVAPSMALASQRVSWALSPERGTPAAVPSLALAAGLVSAPIGLLGNRLSRAVERRADAFALELTGAFGAFVAFERRIALQNVADLEPPRLISSLLSTHPPTLERIGAALAFGRERQAAVAQSSEG